jgi:Protein of unknown function (DUF2877)
MSSSVELRASVAGRFAREALALGEGEVCALFRRSFYLRFPEGRFACIGDASLGRGPLNALVASFSPPEFGARISVFLENASLWQPPRLVPHGSPDLIGLKKAVMGRIPEDGFGCLVAGTHNALSVHAQPALEAIDRWLVGNALGADAAQLIGLGPGLTPSGDDYLGGVMVALHGLGRGTQSAGLWRWLEPRLAERTSAISAAHLAAAAAGEAHEALHACLEELFKTSSSWDGALSQLAAVGHGSGWDGLAGALAVVQ